MKILHTADWQIGMKAAHTGAAASRVREARFASARKVVELANQHEVDALLIAGDTFEHNAVTVEEVERVADVLARCQRPIYLIPGNHDPDVAGGIWRQRLWADLPRLTICREAKPLSIQAGGQDWTLFPCPMQSKYSSEDPTAWIAKAWIDGQEGGQDREGIRVGLAHGSLTMMPELEGQSSPLAPKAATRAGLDYLALGHWHSVFMTDEGRMAYSGTHEATKFGEPRSGNALLVELAGPGAKPAIQVAATGHLRWREERRSLSGLDDLLALRRDLEALPDPRQTLLQVLLDGVLPPEGFAQIEQLSQAGLASFCFFSLKSAKVQAEGEANLPGGVFPALEARLKQLAINGAKPFEAQFALRELYRLAGQIAGEGVE